MKARLEYARGKKVDSEKMFHTLKCAQSLASPNLSLPFLLFCLLKEMENVPLIEFMHLVFTCMPGESYL